MPTTQRPAHPVTSVYSPAEVRLVLKYYAPDEVLSQDAMAQLDQGWRKLVTEIGVQFDSEQALEMFRKAGQKVVGQTVPWTLHSSWSRSPRRHHA